jgi:hypothetical protein
MSRGGPNLLISTLSKGRMIGGTYDPLQLTPHEAELVAKIGSYMREVSPTQIFELEETVVTKSARRPQAFVEEGGVVAKALFMSLQFDGETIAEEPDPIQPSENFILLEEVSDLILAEVKQWNGDLYKRIAKDFGDIHKLTSRQFEELIAELLTKDGYDVYLTPKTKDGGVDIIASRFERSGKIAFAYECKRYRQDRSVGVSFVRALGTAATENNCRYGVLCTTSYFSPDATKLADRLGFIHYQDATALERWITDLANR